MRFQIKHIDQLIDVDARELRHGWKVEAHPEFADGRRYVKAYGAQLRSATQNLKAGITKARDAAALRHMRQKIGLRLVADNVNVPGAK